MAMVVSHSGKSSLISSNAGLKACSQEGKLNCHVHGLCQTSGSSSLSAMISVSLCRHELYSDYKANRSPMPDDIIAAIPRLKVLLKVICDQLENELRRVLASMHTT